MSSRVWIVRDGDGATVEEIVLRAKGDDLAIADGRVFVGRRRAKAGDAVLVGDEVRIGDAPNTQHVRIFFHEHGVLAVDKPAGMPTIPDERSAAGSLLHEAARAAQLPPETLHATSRLDRDVSGVVLFATTPAARERLQNARTSGDYERHYIAISEHVPAPESGNWTAAIGVAKDPKKRRVDGKDATFAETRYRVIATAGGRALLHAQPRTGRTHQIRVHASHAGAALLGDRDYGASRTLVLPSGKVLLLDRIALHCAHVRIEKRTRHDPETIDVTSRVPDELRAWWTALGGDADAFDLVL